MTKTYYTKLSKAVSHALRHKPWIYELELDDQGWVAIKDLLLALQNQTSEWNNLNKTDLIQMINAASKKRHKIDGNRIRALYGHSTPGKLQQKIGVPPEQLFHGTEPLIVNRIMKEGLLPMGRQYVHLSTTFDIAEQVGSRKNKQPVLLLISAKEAHSKGIKFYIGNEAVWLADAVPSEFITIFNRI